MRRRIIPLSLAIVLLLAGVLYLRTRGAESPARRLDAGNRIFSSNDPMKRACDLGEEVLIRLWRGHHPTHSEDITTVPQAPNYSGSFGVTSHSGPWDYVQTIPLVLYGPGFVPDRGRIDEHASIVDVYPTISALLNVGLPAREGENLLGPTAPLPAPPKLIVTVVWDGVGRNVLERWPDAWPNLARLEREGLSYLGATVGSSPSITPATHSSLGTGAFPRSHGVTAIEYRTEEGDVRGAFAGKDPTDLKLSTFADEVDRLLDNEPLVGMLAWKSWHMGMLGHGTQTEGGDGDELVLVNTHGDLTGNEALYTFPSGLESLEGRLEARAEQVDKADGESDGKTRGRDIIEMHDNPAWVYYQEDLLLGMLEQGGYGQDAVPDLFFTNFKVTDIVSHQYSMDSKDEEIALRAQDATLGRLVEYLDKEVGDYVVIVTADHGNTPAPNTTGAWPIQQGQLQEDIDAHFEVPKGSSLIETTSAAGPFLDHATGEKLGIEPDDI
ncbi:MAG TPA: alkaline phosphatase family protein, partial [Actinomycetota bacterium]|nr:alkaline phosphatase family protein [Actinomycetota bacterium]